MSLPPPTVQKIGGILSEKLAIHRQRTDRCNFSMKVIVKLNEVGLQVFIPGSFGHMTRKYYLCTGFQNGS